MKARVKATGEIVSVYCDFKEMKYDFLDETGKGYMSNELTIFDNEDYEQGWNDGYYEATSSNHTPDYWTRLEHQYAGMAMQGLILTASKHMGTDQEVAQWAKEYAHALVEKLKEKEEK